MRLVLLLLLPACFNPDDILPVHGSITSVDAVGGQPVRLLRDSLEGGGSSCSEATAFKETTTDEAGTFSFDVFRAQAQKLTGVGQFCFRAETTFPSGSAGFSDLQGLSSETWLPAFPDWRAQPTRVDGLVRFEPVAPLPAVESVEGNQLAHRAEWRTADGGLAWVMDDRVLSFEGAPVRQPLALDDFALEDFSGTVRLRAHLTEVEATPGGPFGGLGATTVEASSGQTLALTGTKRPVSRGLPCPPLGSPCPLTDGDLTTVDAGNARSLTLTLSSPVPLSAVVLRGLETDVTLIGVVLSDADGGRVLSVQHLLPTSLWNGGAPTVIQRRRRDGGFEVVPVSDPSFSVVSLDAGVPIGAVTLEFLPGVKTRISEVSLFE